MGSYGIGVERSMAAVVESSHDERGIIWPVSVAPYEVVVSVVRPDDEAALAAGREVYERLLSAGVETVLDDRAERPGVKFADAELVGIPFRVTVGPKGVGIGVAEFTVRNGLGTEEIALSSVVEHAVALVEAGRRRL
jgi:prolyl-tRNA synthetase